MKFLIISDTFSLDNWLIEDKEPEIMPAVYEFFTYLGNHENYSFDAVVAHPNINKVVEFPNGSKIYIYKLSVPFHYLRKFASFNFLKQKAKEKLESKTDYDVIYGMTIYANIAREIGEKYNKTSIGRLFGSLIWDVIQKRLWLKLHSRFYYQLQEAKNPCDITICTEDGTQFDQAIHKYSPKSEVHMMFNGVNNELRNKLLSLPAVKKIDSNKEIAFCYIARLTQWKRHDLALNVIFQLKTRYGLRVRLDIYGRGELKSKIEHQIKKLELTDQVQLKGSIAHNKIPETLSKYHSSMFFYDASTLGNALWESALAGRIIFTRNTGKTGDIFNSSNAIIMNNENTEIAADNFIKLLDKDIMITENSRKTVNHLLPSWNDRFDSEMDIIFRK